MKRALIFALISLPMFIACSSERPGSQPRAAVSMWQDEFPIRDAWLRERLPEESMVYIRVPNLLGLITTPKGNALDAGLRTKVNAENVQAVYEGLVENFFSLLPAYDQASFRLLAARLRSPVEIAFRFAPAPGALVTANFRFESAEAFAEELEAAGFSLQSPLDSEGIAPVDGLPMPAFLKFDASTGLLVVNVGAGVSRERFEKTLASLAEKREHRIRNAESKIDDSGQGFFAWIDADNAMGPIRMLVPPEQLQPLVDLGIDSVSTAAFGWGVASGKARLAVVADLKANEARGLIPRVVNTKGPMSAGEPDGLITLSIPTAEEFRRLETAMLDRFGKEGDDSWPEAKAGFAEFMGVSIEALLGAIGPEAAFIMDSAGDYVAVRLREPKVWDTFASNVFEISGSDSAGFTRNGQTFYHWSLPGMPGLGEDDVDLSAWYWQLLMRPREHIYWTRDDDFLYFSSVPQPLFDRAASNERTDVHAWLAETQKISPDNAILTISGTSQKLPQRFYTMYVDLLQFLADVGKANVDIWNMPSAGELRLPVKGTAGLSIELGDPTVAAVLTFENNPLELLGSGGMSSIAAAGILAAIAVPAYQDYTIRAKVSTGMVLAGPLRAQVAEYYAENSRFPGTADAHEMSLVENPYAYVDEIFVDPESGNVVINFDETITGGGTVIFSPTETGEAILQWECSSSLEVKYLPQACR